MRTPIHILLRLACPCLSLFAGITTTAFAAQPVAPAHASPEDMLQAALEAELSGDVDERARLLAEVLKPAPDFAPARWHSGFVLGDNGWQTIEQAASEAQDDRRLIDYRRHRDPMIDTLDNQRQLARWCQKNQLTKQASVHWQKVLAFDHADAEALRALDLRPHQGTLLTSAQINEQRQQKGLDTRAIRHWQPQFIQWRKAIEGNDAERRSAALQALERFDEPRAVPALIAIFAEDGETASQQELNRVLIKTLSHFHEPRTTAALVELSILPDSAKLRESAARALRTRPAVTFVPQLISAWPMETDVETYHFVYQLGRTVITHFETIERDPRTNNTQRQSYDGLVLNLRPPDRAFPMQYNNFIGRNAAMELQIHATHASKNKLAAELRARIQSALTAATDFEDAETLDEWSQQFVNYTESYLPPEFKKNGAIATSTVSETIILRPCSCFPAGTPVQSLTGSVPIEDLRPGDRVLSQDPVTGELAYREVLQRTLRPAVPLVEIGIAGETIRATRGHPFWVNGAGWRMAKLLSIGTQLHSVQGPLTIDSLGEAPAQEAYNLVVSDFGTYFVGQQRILVHDNLPLSETGTLVPGLACKYRN